jgi:formylglycine-generating enzyme required for sulfatase activity
LDATGSDGLPSGTSLLDATATLPAANGVTRVGLALAMACFGVASDPAAKRTCDPGTKALAPEPVLEPGAAPEGLPSPGTWPGGVSVPCSGAPPPGMACLSGGAFLLGSQQSFPDTPATDPQPRHLVVLSPFAIDLAEVTVGQVRSLVEAGGVPAPAAPGDTASLLRSEECTYRGDASNDDAPANCLPWSTADAACRSMGKRLPTEAEWEYAARNLGDETPYPWGSDAAVCTYAVVARGVGPLADPTECELFESATVPGPVAGGSPLDQTSMGVSNMAGNVSEWTADFFAPYSSACWTGGDPLGDPSCQTPSASHSVRGGSWQSAVRQALGAARYAPDSDGPSEAIGFRCAVSM